MAGYSIVLNLSGNAVELTARLATNLALADKNATSLARSLATVSAAARSIPARPIALPRRAVGGTTRAQNRRAPLSYVPPQRQRLAYTPAQRVQTKRLVENVRQARPVVSRVVAPAQKRFVERPTSVVRPVRSTVEQPVRSTVSPSVTALAVRARGAAEALQAFSVAQRAATQSARNASTAYAAAARRLRAASTGRALTPRERVLASSRRTLVQPRTSRAVRVPAQQRDREAYTRHRYTRVASFGTGFNIGGFSGRLSTILQPDENNQIMGMSASKVMKAANVSAITTSILGSVSKAIIKTIAYSTAAPIVAGGLGIMLPLRALQSESFAEGVRLISRRHQAQMGLGDEYSRAESNTDFLAASYGLDRSTTLSSINTLTGLGLGGVQGVDGDTRKLAVGEATGLTKVGGLISQHHGVPFERVMTNIQQLLVQDQPSLRDIRELLNQAPILGKFALKEMEERGVKNMDVRTYLKDQRNILSALKSYELTVATNAGMQARGQIALSQQDAWSTIAGNDDFWRMIGDRGSGIIGSMATGINGLMTSLANSPEFSVMTRNIELMFDNFGKHGDTFITKLINLIDGLAARFGLDLGNKPEARLQSDRDRAIDEALRTPQIVSELRSMWENSTLPVSQSPEMRDKEFNQFLRGDAARYLRNDEQLRERIHGYGTYEGLSDKPWWMRGLVEPFNTAVSTVQQYTPFGMLSPAHISSNIMANTTARENAVQQNSTQFLQSDSTRFIFRPDVRDLNNPASANAAYALPLGDLRKSFERFINETSAVGTFDPSTFKGMGGGEDGEDIRQANRDRRSLIINFNDKLVEWNNTIMSGAPTDVVNEISENIDQITSAAIQRALLGASNKVASSWY